MSYKVKSFLYLSCFIAAFAIYNYSIEKSSNNYSAEPEIAIADLDKVTPKTLLKEGLK
ncbi:MAG: hypothetical protein ACR2MT_01080 [Aurantibacter sp.]